MPSLKAFFTNMSAPVPWPKKIWLVIRNSAIKIGRRRNCCGHHGEPGCCASSGTTNTGEHSPAH